MATKPGSKYYPLFTFLRRQGEDRVQMSLDEIETIIDRQLPPSARERTGFWSNRSQGGHQAEAWLRAGYRVEAIDLQAGQVTFRRIRSSYSVKREQGQLRWDADSIRALREHMGMNQSEMAELLGVRQQTISEWETSAYQPTRSSSKHLTLIAERADFPYRAVQENGEDRT